MSTALARVVRVASAVTIHRFCFIELEVVILLVHIIPPVACICQSVSMSVVAALAVVNVSILVLLLLLRY